MGAVVVTGAARGIGAACAFALADRGTLLLCDLREADLEETATALARAGRNVALLGGDLCDEEARRALAARVEQEGGLSVLAHAAGVSGAMADARRVLEVNLGATAHLLDALEPLLLPGAAGVCLASQAGHFTGRGLDAESEALLDDAGRPDLYDALEARLGEAASGSEGAYGLSKRGVQLLVVARAPAWGQRGARLLSVSPGIVETVMGEKARAANEAAVGVLLERTPVGARMGRPEEIAAVVAFLCSPGASFMSGVDVLVDGGSTGQIIGG